MWWVSLKEKKINLNIYTLYHIFTQICDYTMHSSIQQGIKQQPNQQLKYKIDLLDWTLLDHLDLGKTLGSQLSIRVNMESFVRYFYRGVNKAEYFFFFFKRFKLLFPPWHQSFRNADHTGGPYFKKIPIQYINLKYLIIIISNSLPHKCNNKTRYICNQTGFPSGARWYFSMTTAKKEVY